jgi:CPA2 family monovalent cation:H+ antiporter-2
LHEQDFARLFIQLGGAIVLLAVLARLASRWGFSSISFYLLGGLAFGRGGIAHLEMTRHFIQLGAEIGVLLLLFMLGLEYSGAELRENLKGGTGAGLIDIVLNFPPGFIAGMLLGWGVLASVLLGGVTLISSSGIISKVLSELKRTDAPESKTVLTILVLEDLMMAVYLPIVGVLISGDSLRTMLISVAGTTLTIAVVLFVATRYGEQLSSLAAHQSDEVILLTILGTVLVLAGVAQSLKVSAAIGAFLVGIAVSGPIAEQSFRLLAPLRDLSAAVFFFFFGLEIDPRALPPVLLVALILGAVTSGTKILTGYWATRSSGLPARTRLRAGLTLIARGEFSIVIAGLGGVLEPRLQSLAAAYVLLMAVLGPIAARWIK